jgi:hypothetical protein
MNLSNKGGFRNIFCHSLLEVNRSQGVIHWGGFGLTLDASQNFLTAKAIFCSGYPRSGHLLTG